jgi:hypothetical protein
MADEALVVTAHRIAQLGDDATVIDLDFEAVGVGLATEDMADVVAVLLGLDQIARALREDPIGALADQVGVLGQQPDVVERGVVIDHALVGADEQDAQVHRRKQRLQTRALGFGAGQVVQRLGFGGFQFGNVANAGADAKELAFAAVDRVPVHRRPELRAVFARHAELVALAGCAAQGMLEVLGRFDSVRLFDQAKRKAGQRQAFVRVIAGHPCDRRIDPDGAAGRLDPQFQVVGVVGDGEEALFAVLQFR